jgi:uncharacterized protein (TIGR00645 family)
MTPEPGSDPTPPEPVTRMARRRRAIEALPDPLQRIERRFESLLFLSRWLMAPIYLGLAIALIVLLIAFTKKLFEFVVKAFVATEADVIIGILSLIDLALAGGLLLIVIFSGYENFVSKIEADDHPDWPEWMGKVDFTGLKLKLLSSIVAISAIQVLKVFMDPMKYSDRELFWVTAIHVVFVASGILLALTDRIAEGHKKKPAGRNGEGAGKL